LWTEAVGGRHAKALRCALLPAFLPLILFNLFFETWE
jgi:hypothetical protein